MLGSARIPSLVSLVVVACLVTGVQPRARAAVARNDRPAVIDGGNVESAPDGRDAGESQAPCEVDPAELAGLDPESRSLLGSLLSWAVKKGVKQVTKSRIKAFIKERIQSKLKYLTQKKAVKDFTREADEVLEALEDPWWITAIGFVPIAGDALDLTRVPVQVRNALVRADKLEERVNKAVAKRFKWDSLSRTTVHILDHLDMKVIVYVGKYRKRSILEVLPGEVLDMTLAEALQHSSQAKKLLSRPRFAK